MKLTILIKSILSWLVFVTGVSRLLIKKQAANKQYFIMMYHRIIAADPMIQPGMYVTPETFERHLMYLKNNFTIVPLQQLINPESRQQATLSSKPVCALTFDDGWIDFYQNAFPLLQKYKITATVFLPTKYISTGKQFWTDRLAHILKRIEVKKISTGQLSSDKFKDDIKQIVDLQGSLEQRLEWAAEMLKRYGQSEIEHILDQIDQGFGQQAKKVARDFINWDEVKQMYQSGLIDFGSHTVNHELLTNISAAEIVNELSESKDALIQHQCANEDSLTFCYPNGNFNKEIAAQVGSQGYKLAVTTRNGWNEQDADMLTLNRIGVHQDVSSNVAMYAARIAGIF